MKITFKEIGGNFSELDISIFNKIFPKGMLPTLENLIELKSQHFEVFRLISILPQEGFGSQRHFSLVCSESIAHKCNRSVDHYLMKMKKHIETKNLKDKDLREAEIEILEMIEGWNTLLKTFSVCYGPRDVVMQAMAADAEIEMIRYKDTYVNAYEAAGGLYLAHLSDFLMALKRRDYKKNKTYQKNKICKYER